MISLLLFSLFGILVGVVTGLLPSFHINNLIPLLLSLSFIFPTNYELAIFIVSVAITQIFISYIPSVFLGAPSEDTALSVLPGHRLLLQGRGYEAITIVVFSSLISLIMSLVLIFILSNSFKWLYEATRAYVAYLILFVILLMIFSEKRLKRIVLASFIFLLSGFLGILVLGSSLVSQQNVLFPTLSGLFGLSTVIISMSERSRIPYQEWSATIKMRSIDFLKAVLLGSIAGIIVGFLPAIGVSQAATMMQYLGGLGEARAFLATVSSVNIANEVFSLNSLYLVNNPRSGASVAIQRIMGNLTFNDVLLLIGVICFVAGIASAITLFLGKRIPRILAKLNYKFISICVIVFITTLVFIFTGIFGLLILFTSTSTGILAISLRVRRSHCMGVLLLPSLLFFTNLTPLVLSILRI
ncbi:MAG TPA: hypothetical protein ENG45_00475 [Candidatus Aenigmarchaeota archaeon]|nr:hypothetical protein [Candidatus Aenigmarchaeota archaeon]